MKVFKSAIKYFIDKGTYLTLISVIPSLLLPFLLSPSSTFYFLFQYKDINSESFSAMYIQMRNLPYDYFYVGIVGIVLIVFAVSILIGVVDRHMRIGDFTLSVKKAVTGINFNFLSALLYLVIVCVASEVINLILTAIYYLWATIIPYPQVWLFVSLLFYFLNSYIILMFFATTILFPPFMLHTGYKPADAFKMAWRQITGHVSKTALSIFIVLIPFVLSATAIGIAGAVVGFSKLEIMVARTVLDGVMYTVMIPFFITLMYSLFYEVTGAERVDLVNVSIWKKGFGNNKRKG